MARPQATLPGEGGVATAKRQKAPSRLRYESEHPSLTVRVPAEVKAKVQAAAQAEGLSVSEWVQAMAAGHDPDATAAYSRGLDDGRRQGEAAQAVLDALNEGLDSHVAGVTFLQERAAAEMEDSDTETVTYLRKLAADLGMAEEVEQWLIEHGVMAPHRASLKRARPGAAR